MKISQRSVAWVCLARIAISIFAMFSLIANAQPPPGCDEYPISKPIVFTSAPRDLTPHPPWDDRTLWQSPSDVQNITRNFEESDLEIKQASGLIEVIHNCTNSPVQCAAQEARVSPDAKKIVYSVTFGSLWEHNSLKLRFLGAPINAKLYIYDVASKTSTAIPNQSATVINRMPDWIDNNRLVYSSNAANLYPVRDQWNCHTDGDCTSQTYGYGHESKSMQIWSMNIDGTQQVNLTPQEAMAIRPTVLRHPNNKGRIAYSSWQVSEDKGFYGGGGAVTLANLWWIMTMAPDGTSPTVLVGAHHSGWLNKEAPAGMQQVDEYMALRSVGEDSQGRLYFTNYYRGNHFGLGTVYRMTPPLGDFQVEGCATQDCYRKTMTPSSRKGTGQYVPADLQIVAPWAMGSDNAQNRDKAGRVVGKLGNIAPLSNGHVMATWGQGLCNNEPLGEAGFDGTKKSIGGQPLCDRQIVELMTDFVTSPFDATQLKVLVGSTAKSEWDGVEVTPRPIAHVQPPLDATKGCYLEVADIRNAELYPLDPVFKWNMRAKDVGIQANTVNPHKPMHGARVRSLAVYGVQQHTTMYPDPKFKSALNYTGYESVWYMGKQDMLGDGSVKMQVPCGQSFFMCATDSAGVCVTRDPFLHNLPKGETKTCFGCHDGHSIERRRELWEPQAVFATTLAAKTNPPLVNSKVVEPWATVAAIISKNCSGCHTGFENDARLWHRVFADAEQTDFPWMKRMKNRNGGFSLPRPYFSGLAARYPDWSMLYWVMVGKRTDGWDNADFPDDQDYPTGHPVLPVTPAGMAEIERVVRYIQQGAPRP